MANTTDERIYGKLHLNRTSSLNRKDASGRNPGRQDPNNLSRFVTLVKGHLPGDFFRAVHNNINR